MVQSPFDYDTVLKEYLDYAEQLRPYVADTGVVMDELFAADKKFCLKVHKQPSLISIMVLIRMLPALIRLQVMLVPVVASVLASLTMLSV